MVRWVLTCALAGLVVAVVWLGLGDREAAADHAALLPGASEALPRSAPLRPNEGAASRHASTSQPESLDTTAAHAASEPLRVRVTVMLIPKRELRARSEKPVGVHVTAELIAENETRGELLAEAWTNDQGRVELLLPRAALAQVPSGARLWLKASHPGYLGQSIPQDLPENEEGVLSQYFGLRPGVELAVRIVGPDGEGVAGSLHYSGIAYGNRVKLEAGESGRDGWVRCSVSLEGNVTFLAEGRSDDSHDAFDLGTGALGPLSVNFEAPPQGPLEVRVSGAGVLRGQVIGADGEPAAGLRLHASAEILRDPSVRSDRAAKHALEELGGGHLEGTTLTDSRGYFEWRGLRRAHYRIASRAGWTSSEFTSEPVPADGVPLLLSFTRAHLVVRLFRADGRPFDGDVELRTTIPGLLGAAEGAERPWLLVMRDPAEFPSVHSFGSFDPDRKRFLQPLRVGPSEFSVDVPVAQRLLVGLAQPGAPFVARWVDVPHDAGRIEVDVRVPDSEAPGRLDLRVADPQGFPYTEGVSVIVQDPETACTLASHLQHQPDEGRVSSMVLPPGDYQVRVGPWMLRSSQHGPALVRPSASDVWIPVTIRAGETTEVAARLTAGGRLRVTALGSLRDSDIASDPLRRADGDRVNLTLRQPGDWARPVWFAEPSSGMFAMNGELPTVAVPLGETRTSLLLPAGRYSLIGELPGGRSVTRDVELFDGVTTDVTLDFR